MIWLSKENLILLHDELINKFGGLKGIRDEGILESLVELPFLKFKGNELYLTQLEKIVRLSYSITINHCLFDGNKRLEHFIVMLLEKYSFKVKFSNEELIKIFLANAESKMNYEDLLNYLKEKTTN